MNICLDINSSGPLAPAFSGDFAPLFSGSKIFAIQGDRGITQSTGIITSVTDQANAIAFSANSAGQRPLVGAGYNGHSSIVFDGVDDELNAAVALPSPSVTPYYVYAVFKPTTKAGQGNYFGGTGGGGVLYSSTGNVNSIIQTSGLTGNQSGLTNALSRVYAEFTGSISDRIKAGASGVVSGTSAGGSGDTGVIIGAGLVGGGFASQIDLVLLVYSTGALSAPALTAIDALAIGYWGSVSV